MNELPPVGRVFLVEPAQPLRERALSRLRVWKKDNRGFLPRGGWGMRKWALFLVEVVFVVAACIVIALGVLWRIL